jgi:FkbM family methyltransferase
MEQKHGLLGTALFRIANYRRSFPIRILARGCEGFLRCYNNVNYDAASNGEARILRLLGGRAATCILDVGANVGDYALLAQRLCPTAQIHAFEIVPQTFSVLEARTAGISRITRSRIGLGEQAGRIDVMHCTEEPGLSSVYPWPHGKVTTTITCEVQTGDAYCAAHGLEHVDLLKLDIEGAELPALRGFERMLSSGRIDAVQFEYGYVNIMPRFLLRDLTEFLSAHGYRVGKIFPMSVDFKRYELTDEDFQGPNYLAVRESRADLVTLLA